MCAVFTDGTASMRITSSAFNLKTPPSYPSHFHVIFSYFPLRHAPILSPSASRWFFRHTVRLSAGTMLKVFVPSVIHTVAFPRYWLFFWRWGDVIYVCCILFHSHCSGLIWFSPLCLILKTLSDLLQLFSLYLSLALYLFSSLFHLAFSFFPSS